MFVIQYYWEILPMHYELFAVYTPQSWVFGDDKACRQGLVWKNGFPVLTFAFSAYSLIQRSPWGMVQLFKVIVLMSVVLVLALVGIVHQVSWSPGQFFSTVIFKSARRSKCLWIFWFSTVGFQAHLGQEDSILYSILWFGKLGVFGTSPGKAFKGTHRIGFIVTRPHICHFFSTQIVSTRIFWIWPEVKKPYPS